MIDITKVGWRIEPPAPIDITLDRLPPTVNHIYRSNGRGGKVLTDEVITFRHEVVLAVRNMRVPADTDLACTVRITFGKKRRGSHRVDVDNRIKSLGDALALALDFDDCCIVEWHAYGKRGDADCCRVILEPSTSDW